MSIQPNNVANLQKAFETELTNEIINSFREAIFKDFPEEGMWYVPNDPTKALFSSASIQQIIKSHDGQFMHPNTRAMIPTDSFAKADKYLSIFFFLMLTVAENKQEGQGIKTIIEQDEDLQPAINNFSHKYVDDSAKKEIKAEIAKVQLYTETETANEPWCKYIKALILRFETTYPTAFADIFLEEKLQLYEKEMSRIGELVMDKESNEYKIFVQVRTYLEDWKSRFISYKVATKESNGNHEKLGEIAQLKDQIIKDGQKIELYINKQSLLISTFNQIQQKFQNHLSSKIDELTNSNVRLLAEKDKINLKKLKKDFLEQMSVLESYLNNTQMEFKSDNYPQFIEQVSSQISNLQTKLEQIVKTVNKFQKAIDLIARFKKTKKFAEDSNFDLQMKELREQYFVTDSVVNNFYSNQKKFWNAMIKFESDINNMRLGVESSNNYDQEIDLLSENITKLEKDLKSRLLLIQKLKSDMQYKTDLIQKLHDIKQFWTGGGTHGGLRSLLNQVIDNQVLSPHTNAKARKFKGYVEKEIQELENDITTTEYDQQQMNSLWNAIDVLGTTLATESEHINRLQNTMKHKADLVQQFRDIQGRFTTNGALRFLQDYSGSEIRSQEQKKLTRQCQKVQTDINCFGGEITNKLKRLKISDLQTTINKLNLQLNDLEQQIKNFLHNLQDGQLNDLEQQMQALISERNTGTNRRTNRRTDILTRTAQNRLPGSENIDRLDSAAEPRHRRWRP